MKRYDLSMYNGEADVLECRLTELEESVDWFVIAEADRTHGGNNRKPLHLATDHRFDPWRDRIRYIEVLDMPSDPNPWVREGYQREQLMRGISDAGSEDIILLSDVDEIPDPARFKYICPGGMTLFMQTLYCMNLNWKDTTPWQGTVASRRCEIATLNRMRENRRWVDTTIADAGWHLSWMGGQAAMVEKFWNGCHSDDFDMTWDAGTGQFLNSQLTYTEVDDSYPLWVREGNAPASWYGQQVRRET